MELAGIEADGFFKPYPAAISATCSAVILTESGGPGCFPAS